MLGSTAVMSVMIRNGEMDGSRRRNTYREIWNSGFVACSIAAMAMLISSGIAWGVRENQLDEAGARLVAPTLAIAAIGALIIGFMLRTRRRLVRIAGEGLIARTGLGRARLIPWRNIADIDMAGGSNWQSALVAEGEEISPLNPRYGRWGTLLVWTTEDIQRDTSNGLRVPSVYVRLRMKRGLDACDRIERIGREYGVNFGAVRDGEAARRLEIAEAYKAKPLTQPTHWWRGETRNSWVGEKWPRAAPLMTLTLSFAVGWSINSYINACRECEHFTQAVFTAGYAVNTGWVPAVIENDYPSQSRMRVVCPRWVPLGHKRSFTCSVRNGDFDRAHVRFTSRDYDAIEWTTSVTRNYSPRIEKEAVASYRNRFPNIDISCPSGISTTGVTKEYLKVVCSVEHATFTSLAVTIAVKEGIWWWQAPYASFSNVTDWVETSVADAYIEDHPKITLDCPDGIPVKPRKPFRCSVTGAPFAALFVDLKDPTTDDIYFEEIRDS